MIFEGTVLSFAATEIMVVLTLEKSVPPWSIVLPLLISELLMLSCGMGLTFGRNRNRRLFETYTNRRDIVLSGLH